VVAGINKASLRNQIGLFLVPTNPKRLSSPERAAATQGAVEAEGNVLSAGTLTSVLIE
jgi:hypothetical protein